MAGWEETEEERKEEKRRELGRKRSGREKDGEKDGERQAAGLRVRPSTVNVPFSRSHRSLNPLVPVDLGAWRRGKATAGCLSRDAHLCLPLRKQRSGRGGQKVGG